MVNDCLLNVSHMLITVGLYLVLLHTLILQLKYQPIITIINVGVELEQFLDSWT